MHHQTRYRTPLVRVLVKKCPRGVKASKMSILFAEAGRPTPCVNSRPLAGAMGGNNDRLQDLGSSPQGRMNYDQCIPLNVSLVV